MNVQEGNDNKRKILHNSGKEHILSKRKGSSTKFENMVNYMLPVEKAFTPRKIHDVTKRARFIMNCSARRRRRKRRRRTVYAFLIFAIPHPSHRPRFNRLNNVCRRLHIMEVPITHISPHFRHFHPFRLKYSPQHPALKHLSLFFP
jgi:hypothetical protein